MKKKLLLLCLLTLSLLSPCPALAQAPHPSEQAFMAEAEEMFQKGNKLLAQALPFQANYYYGLAVVAVSSLRYGLAEIIYVKQREEDKAALKEKEEKEKQEREEKLDGMDIEDGGLLSALFSLADKLGETAEKMEEKVTELGLDEDSERLEIWDFLASLSMASPYPYFFEAISWDYKGKEQKAAECYANAVMNPMLKSSVLDFTYWEDMSAAELRVISRRLKKKEDEYLGAFTLIPFSAGGKRDPMAFYDEYLTAKAYDILKKDPADASNASRLYEQAVYVNPFNASNFAGAALLCGLAGDMKKAAFYLNEGLLLDPDHKGLKEIAGRWKGGKP